MFIVCVHARVRGAAATAGLGEAWSSSSSLSATVGGRRRRGWVRGSRDARARLRCRHPSPGRSLVGPLICWSVGLSLRHSVIRRRSSSVVVGRHRGSTPSSFAAVRPTLSSFSPPCTALVIASRPQKSLHLTYSRPLLSQHARGRGGAPLIRPSVRMPAHCARAACVAPFALACERARPRPPRGETARRQSRDGETARRQRPAISHDRG